LGIITFQSIYKDVDHKEKVERADRPSPLNDTGTRCTEKKVNGVIKTTELVRKVGRANEPIRGIKLIRNWYKAHLRGFGIRWRWKGKGFIALDGVSLVNQIRSLRL